MATLTPATATHTVVNVFCHAPGCRNPRPIAQLVDGRYVVRDHGREHVVLATTCHRCGTVREFNE